MHYWLGSFCRVINNDKLYFPINVVAVSDIIKLEKDLGNQIPNKCWMLYLLELFNIHNKPVELNLICQFDNQNYFEAIFLGINRYRFKNILPKIDHSYQRIIYLDEENNQIKYILTDQTTNKSEIFKLDIKNINFVYKTSNQFTGIEWWNKIGSFIYNIRYQIEISQLMFGLTDKNNPESVLFFPHNVLIPNKDDSLNNYPVTFQNIRLKDNCICYNISYGLCDNGLSYS
ncbi:MAG TPA: hypothetical protein VFK40_03450 [Nitrososphaeraceae archaeon]|nr:hypothetical protein [Nitrososphaeraceae archaeon]